MASQQAGLRQRVAELEHRLEQRDRGVGQGPMNREEALEALGEEVSRILLAAEETATEIRARAEDEVERQRRELLDEVRDEVRHELEEARERAARLVAEAEQERDEVLEELRMLREARDELVGELRAAAERLRETTLRLEEAGGLDPELDPGEAPRPADAAEARAGGGPSGETPSARPVVTIVDEAVSDLVGSEIPTAAGGPGSTPGPAEADPSQPPDAPTTDGTADPTSRPVALRARTLAAVRPGMVRRLKRSLQDLQNETLTAVRESADRRAVERLLPPDDEVDAIDRVAERFLTAAFRGGAGDAAALSGAPLDADTVGAEGLAEVRAGLGDALDRELTGALRGTLQAGVDAGEPGAMLSERVGQVFRDVRLSVLDELVEEALVGAYSRGLIGAWERLGQERIVWVPVDERRCPERRCSTNAAEGPVRTGDRFPSGHAVPPAHPACGCALEPAPAGSRTRS